MHLTHENDNSISFILSYHVINYEPCQYHWYIFCHLVITSYIVKKKFYYDIDTVLITLSFFRILPLSVYRGYNNNKNECEICFSSPCLLLYCVQGLWTSTDTYSVKELRNPLSYDKN